MASPYFRSGGRIARLAGRVCVIVALSGCSSAQPIVPDSLDTPPLVRVPTVRAGSLDQRARFREIFCAVNAALGPGLPDARPCEDGLRRLAGEGAPSERPVHLDEKGSLAIGVVMGLGGNCVENFLRPDASMPAYLATRGYQMERVDVNGLSSSEENAGLMRSWFERRARRGDVEPLVLLAYSKGIADTLVALEQYPEIRSQVRAVISVAGAVGGSPLAEAAPPWLLRLFKLAPDSECRSGDLDALESLRPAVRQKWLAEHAIPESIPFYSLVTLPSPDQISNGLRSSYEQLSQIDPRNDSQLLFYDQVVPGSRLLGYVNADHLAIVLPIDRSHPWLAELAADKNAFPREVLLEAVLRHVEEDLRSEKTTGLTE